jgi:hypothetical protein
MSIPGFTAEASLYKTSELYHAAIETNPASILTGGVVHLAQSIILRSAGSNYGMRPFNPCVYPVCIDLPDGTGNYHRWCYCL